MTVASNSLELVEGMAPRRSSRLWWVLLAAGASAFVWKGSIVTIGNESAGSTAILWRTGALNKLSMVDSGQRQCGGSFICEGSLAFALRDHPWKLRIGGYSSLVAVIAGK